jgi:hypothetical protein
MKEPVTKIERTPVTVVGGPPPKPLALVIGGGPEHAFVKLLNEMLVELDEEEDHT